MFAYCNNNPINLSDSRGTIPFYDHPFTKPIEDFVQWYRETDENEESGDGSATLNAKIKRSLQSAENNLIFTAGVGLGLYGGIIATDYASLDAGLHYDVLRVEYSGGNLEIFEYGYQGVEASLFFINLGKSEERCRPYSGKPNQWTSMESSEVLPVFGVGAYLFGGGTLAVGFDLLNFISAVDEIWRH